MRPLGSWCLRVGKWYAIMQRDESSHEDMDATGLT